MSEPEYAPGTLYGFIPGYKATPDGYAAVIAAGACRDASDAINMNMPEPYEIALPDSGRVVVPVFAFAGGDGKITRLSLDGTLVAGEFVRVIGSVVCNYEAIRKGLSATFLSTQ